MSKDKKAPKKEDVSFDMYHFFSRWDVIMVVAFIVAFLIFAAALFFNPQAV